MKSLMRGIKESFVAYLGLVLIVTYDFKPLFNSPAAVLLVPMWLMLILWTIILGPVVVLAMWLLQPRVE